MLYPHRQGKRNGNRAVTAWEGAKFNLGNWELDWFKENRWFYVFGGVIWAVPRYACNQHMEQKHLMARGAYAGIVVWILFTV